jgi:hypothetical protein
MKLLKISPVQTITWECDAPLGFKCLRIKGMWDKLVCILVVELCAQGVDEALLVAEFCTLQSTRRVDAVLNARVVPHTHLSFVRPFLGSPCPIQKQDFSVLCIKHCFSHLSLANNIAN